MGNESNQQDGSNGPQSRGLGPARFTRTDRRGHGTQVLRAVLLGTTLTLAACTNPLTSHPMDYAPATGQAGLDRLRTVRSLDVGRYRSPDSDRDGSSSVEQSAAAARDRFAGLESIDLGLENARAAALKYNLDLEVAMINPTIANESLNEEEGRFNAVFTLDASWNETDSPTASTLSSSQSRFQSFTPGLTIPLRTGGTATIRMPFGRSESDNFFSTLNPALTSDVEFSLSHNLLRGAGRRAATHGIRIADYNRRITGAQTKLSVIRQLAGVDRSYWRLYAAIQALEVREQQYTLGEAQLARAQRLNKAGKAADIEVVRAQSGLASRVEQIIVAQNAVLLRQRELKRVVNIPGMDVDSSVRVEPVSPPDPVRYSFDAGELTAAALENRMEMLQTELQLATDALGEAFARNQALPLFAMSYTYRVNGLGGTLGESVNLLGENNFEDWSIGLRGEIPIGNEQRKAAVARAVLSRLQRLGTKQALEQSIRKEVYDAVDQIETTWQRIWAARQSVLLATQSFEAEGRQFDAGRSTSNDVLDADTRLGEARLSEIQAIVDYQIAQVDLAFATGTLLGADRVRWEPLDPRGGPRDSEPVRSYRKLSGIFPRLEDDARTKRPQGQ